MVKDVVVCASFCLLFCLLPQFSPAQTHELKFQHLTTEDGLPTNSTYKIIKDSHGMIWITTGSGLCRYDGYDFKIYQYNPSDTTSLSHDNLHGPILEDRDGNLWIGTLFGLNKFDPFTETFIHYTNDPDNPESLSSSYIKSLFQDRSGFIWIGTGLKSELNKYDPLTSSFISYKIVQQDTMGFNLISSIYEDRDDILWVGTSHGLFQFDRQHDYFIPILPAPPLPDNFVPVYRKIMEDHLGNLWFITDWAILTYEKNKGDSALLRPMWGGETQATECSIRDMLIEPIGKDHILWIATCGLTILNPISRDYIAYRSDPDDPEGVAGNEIRGIFKDESNIIWVTSSQCLNILDKQLSQVKRHKTFYDDYQADATVLLNDRRNNYWIGTNGKGILYFDEKKNLIHQYNVSKTNKNSNKPSGVIRAILEDSDNNIWVGTSKGLYLLGKQTHKFEKCLLAGAITGSKTTPYSVHVIFEDSDGIIWVGTQSGIYQNNKNLQPLTTFTNVLIQNYQMTRPVRSIIEDSYGYLWIGVDATGLYCQPPELRGTDKFIHYMHEAENSNSLGNSNVMSIYEDFHGNLWIGTRRGLNKYNRESNGFERILFKSNPGANYIYDINSDNRQHLWLSTQEGLLRLNLESINNYNEKPYSLKKFLSFKDIRPGKILSYNNGALFIGAKSRSKNGYFSFHPDSIKENHIIPPVVITGFQVNNKSVKLDSNILFKKHIVLNYNDNFFSFKFAALDYTDPEQNQYAYYLEGLEDDWIYSGTRRNAYYTGVSPGEYIFRAKGSNNDGYWNEEGASIIITILPPPWKTWWAYSIYGILFLSLLYGLRRYDLKRQRLKQELEIEHMEAEKLKELDSMKSRFFANISHEFRTPLTLILGPLEKIRSKIADKGAEQDLNIMQRNALRLQRLINQLLNLSKLESGKLKLQADERNVIPLIKGYVQSFESLAKQKGIDLIFTAEMDDIPAWIDQDKVEKILYNLLSNAFKFTESGGRIEVKVARKKVASRQSAVGSQHTADDSLELDGRKKPAASHRLPATGYRLPTADNTSVEIKISDTGPGIPPENLPHIFNRFYQVDDSYTKDGEGTGIGLALTRELVELHHGEITVDSEVGVGTTFQVYLPLGKEHLSPEEIVVSEPRNRKTGIRNQETGEEVDSRRRSEATSALGGSAVSNTSKIDNRQLTIDNLLVLIVEDNADLRLYIRGYLDQTYQVIEASDGQQGLERAIEHIPDLIISDLMMPKMDGYELCKKLKADERTSHIPVILLTAKASMENKLEGLETGADDFITKPFDQQELRVRISNLIEQRQRLKKRFMKIALRSDFSQLLQLPESGVSSTDQKFIQKAVNVVEKHMTEEEFNAEKFQQEMYMSRMQLHRKLKAITNQSATGFIRTLRLKRAADLLANKTGNVSEIAFEVGFSSLSYFAKSFKKQYGVLPSEYTA